MPPTIEAGRVSIDLPRAVHHGTFMNILHSATLDVFADYHQFYIQDGGIFPDAPVDWTDEDVASRAKVEDNIVVVCPVRNMDVPVTIEVADNEPSFALADYDHVVRCSLALPTGCLQVHECTGGELLRLAIREGTYSVVVLYSGLDTLSEDGLDGEDRYHVILWPGQPSPLVVLKAFTE
jgi:hypothetical protein